MNLSAYHNPGLHFSGGKDSLACLYLLRDRLDAITVYWVNTGDGCPETLSIVAQVRQWVPHFVEVTADVARWKAECGIPSDLAPAKGHTIGVSYGMSDQRIVNRFDCCYHNLMRPMHERMLADGVDLVIRGTKRSDTGALPADGKTEFYDIWLPLRDWSHDDVFAYLDLVGAPKNPIYEHFKGISAPECMGCTAWWDDGKAAYLKARHPEKLAEYRVSLQAIKAALQSHLADLETELKE
jgi:3'-phosphoadenosine 5'-phosphosulfate sulfotransferase (PAPS reductase)/FAD synthetase